MAVPSREPPPRLFALHDTAYARHELETADGSPIATGTRGKVVRLSNHNDKHGWSYDVDFDGIGISWCFERELTPLEPIPGIKITRGTVVLPGAALPPTDAELKRNLIEAGLQPTLLNPSPILPENDFETSVAPDEEQTLAIRIIKPTPMPSAGEPLDAVQLAIRTVKTESIVASPTVHIPNGRMTRIDQAYIGELTGSITGQVFCYGWSVHEDLHLREYGRPSRRGRSDPGEIVEGRSGFRRTARCACCRTDRRRGELRHVPSLPALPA